MSPGHRDADLFSHHRQLQQIDRFLQGCTQFLRVFTAMGRHSGAACMVMGPYCQGGDQCSGRASCPWRRGEERQAPAWSTAAQIEAAGSFPAEPRELGDRQQKDPGRGTRQNVEDYIRQPVMVASLSSRDLWIHARVRPGPRSSVPSHPMTPPGSAWRLILPERSRINGGIIARDSSRDRCADASFHHHDGRR